MDNWKSLRDVTMFFLNDEKMVINMLIEKKLLKQLTKCSKCRVPQVLRRHQSFKGNFGAFCKKCKKFWKLTKNTFFDNMRVSFEMIMSIVWCWCSHLSVQATKNILHDVTLNTIAHYFRYFRGICSFKLMSRPPMELGGEGHVVQIDESLIAKAKYGRGHPVPQRWVFGMIDTTSRRGMIQFVEERNADTLIALIQKHVIPGSTIRLYSWRPYSRLKDLGYEHYINHSVEDGTCTYHVESYWAKLKKYCRKVDVLQSDIIKEYTDEFIWRKEYCKTKEPHTIFNVFLDHLRETYPV
uniref:ISXO2-like transposase domain-containing protein n=1 Tax=Cacopsylla melanoneura TaxID=428564 RepID=A0A8D8QFD7_9HEMI